MIGLDIDGVLYPWHEAVHEYYVRQGKVDKDMTFNEFWTGWWWEQSEMFYYNTLRLQTLYEIFPPKESLLSFLRGLGEVMYVTARPPELERVTRRFFKKYDFPYADDIVFAEDKESVVLQYRIDTFVEDRTKTANILSRVCKSYLVNKPWNIGQELSKGVVRINNIMEIVK